MPDLYDPMSILSAYNPLLQAGLRGQPRIPLMQPQETESLLNQVTGGALGGMSYAAKSLSKAFGGRAIRGLLGGNPRELLSIIPFSDKGLTDETQEVTGEDLAKKWGWLQGEGEKGTLEARDFVGPAIEAALDPGTYLSFGAKALNPLGQAARKLGIAPKTMSGRIAGFAAGSPELTALAQATGKSEAELASKALGGVTGIGLPFAHPSVTLGEGAGGAAIAKYLGNKWDRLAYSGLGKVTSAVFDPDVRGVLDESTQRAARELADQSRLSKGLAKGKMVGLLRGLQEGGGIKQTEALRAGLEDTFRGPQLPAVQEAIDKIRSDNPLMNEVERFWGIPARDLLDREASYATRHVTPLERTTGGYEGFARRNFPTGHASLAGREEALRDFPGGTVYGVNPASVDPALRAGTNAQARDIIFSKYYGLDPVEMGQLQTLAAAKTITPQQLDRLSHLETMWERAPQAAAYFRGLDPNRVTSAANPEGLALFRNHPAIDYGARAAAHERSVGNAQIAYNALTRAATDIGGAGPKGEKILDVLANILPENALAPGNIAITDYLKSNAANLPALTQLPEGSIRRMAEALKLSDTPEQQLAALAQMYVPASTAKALSSLNIPFQVPEALEPIIRKWDSATNLTRMMQTRPWPSFNVRNFFQQMFTNVAGIGPGTIGELGPINALRRGEVVKGLQEMPLFRGLTDDQATKKLADMLTQHDVLRSPTLTQGGEVIGHGPHMASSDFQMAGPGNPLTTVGDYAHTLMNPQESSWKPWDVAGFGGRNKTTFWPAKAGQQLETAIDDMTRGSGMLNLLRQGFTPEAAAMELHRVAGGASNMTDIERQVIRRLVPFYGWMKYNTPFVAKEVATNPGGLMAMAMKGAGSLRRDEGYVPEYLGQGLALPVGQEESGQQRFLTRFDLPFEAAFENIGGGNERVGSTLRNLLGQANPLIKGPLELATGKQLYTGRDLSDLYGPTGNVLIDQAIMNSPLSRFYTTGRTLADPRKDLLTKLVNLISPARLSDVDLDKQRIIEGTKALKEQLSGNPAVKHFEAISVSPQNVAQLSPQELELYRLYKTIQEMARKRGQEKINVF